MANLDTNGSEEVDWDGTDLFGEPCYSTVDGPVGLTPSDLKALGIAVGFIASVVIVAVVVGAML